jgi:hypothetical protein
MTSRRLSALPSASSCVSTPGPSLAGRNAAPRSLTRIAPWEPTAPGSAPWPAPAGTAQLRRVLVARTRLGSADAVGLAARLLEAAGAVRCVEIEDAALASGDARALARLVGDGDALLVDALPRPRGAADECVPLPSSLRVTVRLVSAFGSAVTRPRPPRPDLPIVAPTDAGAAAWERAAEVAFALAEAEGRDEVWCAVREPGLLASDRARRFRRAALQRGGAAGRRLTLADARRRLLFPHGAGPEVLLAEADELDGLVRAAAAGVGWSNAIPSLHLGEGVTLAEVASGAGAHRLAANGQLALAAARLAARLLRRLGQPAGARRLDAAVAVELVALSLGRLDPWIELAGQPAIRFAGAVLDRLAAPASPAEAAS